VKKMTAGDESDDEKNPYADSVSPVIINKIPVTYLVPRTTKQTRTTNQSNLLLLVFGQIHPLPLNPAHLLPILSRVYSLSLRHRSALRRTPRRTTHLVATPITRNARTTLQTEPAPPLHLRSDLHSPLPRPLTELPTRPSTARRRRSRSVI
jgi:hypothetical protein